MNRERTRLSICLEALLVVLLLVAAVRIPLSRKVIRHVLARPARMLTDHTRFNSVEWKNSSIVHKSPYIRKQMVGDLMEHYHLAGMNRTGVINLLGKPDDTYESASCWYFLNPDGWGDADILDIHFDASGNVKTAKISNN